MSGFLLWWSPEGAALDDGPRARAERLLARRGPEGVVRREAPGLLAVHTRFTEAVGAEDDLPFINDRWVVAGDLRLDDQARLRAQLRDAGAEPARDATDAALLAAALDAWGEDAARRLVGDFAFAALDRRNGQVVAARGNRGVKLLFVARTPEAIACSNDVELLAGLPGVDASVDGRTVAEFLQSGAPWSTARTFFRGVARVPASMQWTLLPARDARARRIWEFPQSYGPPYRASDEVVEGFHEVLGAAVRDRLRARSANVLLSGGLDSSVLAATARRASPAVALHALTLTSEPIVPDVESAWALRVADALHLSHDVVRAVADDTLRHCDDPSLRTPEPFDEVELVSWRGQFTRLATRAPVTLFGEDGDALLAPPALPTILRTQPWGETWRSWRDYRRKTGARPWVGLREWLRGRRATGVADTTTPTWLRTEHVRALRATEPAPAGIPDAHTSLRPRRHPTRWRAVDALEAPLWETVYSSLDPSITGQPHGVALPLLDARVVAFVFALPPIPWCQRKYLMRRSFRGALPEDVLRRPKTPVRGYFEAQVARWRASGGVAREVSDAVDPFVDRERWRAVIERSPDTEAVLAAWRVYELDRWLRQPAADA